MHNILIIFQILIIFLIRWNLIYYFAFSFAFKIVHDDAYNPIAFFVIEHEYGFLTLPKVVQQHVLGVARWSMRLLLEISKPLKQWKKFWKLVEIWQI